MDSTPPSKIVKNHVKDKKTWDIMKNHQNRGNNLKNPEKSDLSRFYTDFTPICPDFPKIPTNFQNSITFEPHIVKICLTTQIKANLCSLWINNHLYCNLCRFSLIHLRNQHKNGIIGESRKTGKI